MSARGSAVPPADPGPFSTLVTVLAVACRSAMLRPPSPSEALWIWQSFCLHPGGLNTSGAGYTLSGLTPFDRAVASVKGLNDDPACRPMMPPDRLLPLKQVGSTRYLSAGFVTRFGQPPNAKLTDPYCPEPKLRPLILALTKPVRGSIAPS